VNILNKYTVVEFSPSTAFHLRPLQLAMEKMFKGNVRTTHMLPDLPYAPVPSFLIFHMVEGAEQTGSDNLWPLQICQECQKKICKGDGKGMMSSYSTGTPVNLLLCSEKLELFFPRFKNCLR